MATKIKRIEMQFGPDAEKLTVRVTQPDMADGGRVDVQFFNCGDGESLFMLSAQSIRELRDALDEAAKFAENAK